MDFEFSEEQKLLQQTVRRYVQEELLPLEDQFRGRARLTREEVEPLNDRLREKAQALGLWNLAVPKEFGGQEMSAIGQMLVREETAKFFGPAPIDNGIQMSVEP